METGTLYLCATPIGNLDDITVRTLNTLKMCDLIACEDTRHSLKLLNHFDITKPLTSYFEHNKKEKGAYLVSQLKDGKNIALVTDAGTPAISDPGEDLVRLCIDEGIKVVPVPGCVALINALIISGQYTGRFAFEGFLSMNKKSRKDHLESAASDTHTLIFYEAPHKLTRTLADMLKYFGNRRISIIRELTKIHEECRVTTLEEAIEYYKDVQPKGEYVLVIEGKSQKELDMETRDELGITDPVEYIKMLMEKGTDKKTAVKEAAKVLGISKREVYDLAKEIPGI
ncbi:MAG: 16S rRNA (cytidine(1402)-2'-O)-methyltransferase [Clostridia bacterium]|nr:16S rRNA (cytidine(1402)-2'-O)-methyltransferase [Clostridia bacterium]